MKLKKYTLIFILGLINGTILSFFHLSFWLEVGIYASVMAIIVMIIFRDKL